MVLHGIVLRGIAFCYAIAFISFGAQLPGLIGDGGLAPIAATLAKLLGNNWQDREPPLLARRFVTEMPSLLLFSPRFGIAPSTLAEFFVLVGAVVGVFLTSRRQAPSSIGFAFLYLLYLSLFLLSSPFLSFQWDILLLEAGVAAALASPAWRNPDSPAMTPPGQMLMSFASCKLMLMAGVVKLMSGCETWSRLTATEVHFASQCIPSPLAWWAHNAPPLIHRVAVAVTLWLELPGALLLLLAPLSRTVAIAGVSSQLLLQILIAVTGNYTYFNMLSGLLILTVLPQPSATTAGELSSVRNSARRLLSVLEVLLLVLASVVSFAHMFAFAEPVRVSNTHSAIAPLPWWLRWDASIRREHLSPVALQRLIDDSFPWVVWVGGGMLLLSVVTWLVSELRGATANILSHGTLAQRPLPYYYALLSAFTRVAWAIAVCLACLAVFACSATSLLSLASPKAASTLPAIAWTIAGATHPWHLSSGYGLFRSMTGVGPAHVDQWGVTVVETRRPELELQGLWLDEISAEATNRDASSNTGGSAVWGDGPEYSSWLSDLPSSDWSGGSPVALRTGTAPPSVADALSLRLKRDHRHVVPRWRPLPFAYKPGPVMRAPPIVAPHQPRVDWQMWFAALAGDYRGAPWLLRLIQALGEGSPEVYALLDARAWPVVAHVRVSVTSALNASTSSSSRQYLVPPDFVRVVNYAYDFTRLAPVMWGAQRHDVLGGGNRTTTSRNWWQRELAPNVARRAGIGGSDLYHWLAPIEPTSPALASALNGAGLPTNIMRSAIAAATLRAVATQSIVADPISLSIEASMPRKIRLYEIDSVDAMQSRRSTSFKAQECRNVARNVVRHMEASSLHGTDPATITSAGLSVMHWVAVGGCSVGASTTTASASVAEFVLCTRWLTRWEGAVCLERAVEAASLAWISYNCSNVARAVVAHAYGMTGSAVCRIVAASRVVGLLVPQSTSLSGVNTLHHLDAAPHTLSLAVSPNASTVRRLTLVYAPTSSDAWTLMWMAAVLSALQLVKLLRGELTGAT